MTIVRGSLIFCEGESGSPDIRFWNRVLTLDGADMSLRALLTPIGGKASTKGYARGFAEAKSQRYVVIRDRDLDEEPNIPEGVVKPVVWDNGKIILTGYTCLESYFIEPIRVSEFSGGQYTTEQLTRKLHETVRELRDYQAVRWALQSFRRRINTAARESYAQSGASDSVNLPNRWKDKDGDLPGDLGLSACKSEAEELIAKVKKLFSDIDLSQFVDTVERYRAKFDGDDFWAGGYRAWFHGKDVLYRWLSGYQISGKKYLDYAAGHVPIDFDKTPDLRDIREACRA